jgi:hypothetical protein
VYVDATSKGYIRADLVKVAGTGTISKLTSDSTSTTTTTTTASTTTDTSETQVTAVDSKTCTVSQNSVRIRKGASTNHDVVATANRGMTLTITGEATGSDGKTWYQVTFTYNSKEITGFIRSDLVTFDEVSNDAAVSEIQGELGEESNVEAETEQTTETQQEETTSDNSSQGIVLMNVDETPYILPGFTAVSLSWNDESIQAYSNGGFYLFYARMENGDEGWYIFDSEKNEYQRYVYTASATATIPTSSEGVGIVPVIILVIIIIILIALVGLLFLKLKDASYSDEYDDDGDDSDDGDDLEFEEIEPRRSQRAQPQQRQSYQQNQNAGGQHRPVQNGQAQSGANGQMRRPVQNGQGQVQAGANGQVRRPVQNGQVQAGANGQVRRPAPNGQVRRPAPNGQGQTGANGQVRRPQQRPVAANQNANVNSNNQQGYKAKPILENKDDDMDFIDL